ncbi:Ig-like domain-containing protein [Vibrio sp. TBV020]|uniref:Ig-like domain-containing protein n=1 Tax=Vibrio sp. TBV020 TaxID=3137398 RepID=UPI0038CDC9E7
MSAIKWILAVYVGLLLPNYAQAEGSYQLGISLGGVGQPLHENTVLYVHARAGETIQINACDAEKSPVDVEIYDTYVTGGMYAQWNLLSALSSPVPTVSCTSDMTGVLPPTALQYTVSTDGVYVVRFVDADDERIFERWDVSVTSANLDPVDATLSTGNLFSYTWSFVTEGDTQDQATTTRLYAVAPGGFDNTNYVWVLDLNEFSGHTYSIMANSVGLPAPDSGLSRSYPGPGVPIPEFPVFLSYPAAADIGSPPTEAPSFITGSEPKFVGTDGKIGFYPNLGETGRIIFTPNITGTYAVKIDTNRDGRFAESDMYILGETTANAEVIVEWNGTDNQGNKLAQGQYNIEVELRVGEYHFVAFDVETSGGGVENGLTILQAIDEHSVVGTRVYWDDATFLGGSSTLPDGVMSSEGNGPHRHTWGDFTSDSLGNNAYIDTYTIGDKAAARINGQLLETGAPEFVEGFERTIELVEGTTSVGQINVTGGAPGYSYFLAGVDAALFTLTASGQLSFVSAPDFSNPTDHDGNSAYELVVTATDSFPKSSQQNITVNVIANNVAPIAHDGNQQVVEDSQSNPITLSASDSDGDRLSYTVTTSPAFGTLSGTAPNMMYTPNPNFIGHDSFQFSVFDGKAVSNLATVNIGVLADLDGDLDPDITDPDDDGDNIPDVVEGNIDSDGDDIPNNRDTDSDGDGISDLIEGVGDSDNDLIPDYLDISLDSDLDGVPDIIEGHLDVDGDGLANFLDIDSDNDGLLDGFEAGIEGFDYDNDGIDDRFDVDVTHGSDSNRDGIDDHVNALNTNTLTPADFLNRDSDGDYVPDFVEAILTIKDINSNQINDLYEVEYSLGEDFNLNGLDDRYEVSIAGGRDVDSNGFNDALFPASDADGDNRPDFRDQDSDNDSLSDGLELQATSQDTDGDGIDDRFDSDLLSGVDNDNNDVDDGITLIDNDNDGVSDFHDLDSDNDTILDVSETNSPDLDGNGIVDTTGYLAPINLDTDSDTIPNAIDLDSNNDGVWDIQALPTRTLDLNDDGRVDISQGDDPDGDGISTLYDLVPDQFGSSNGEDYDQDGVANHLDKDDDNDGIADIKEQGGDRDGDSIQDYFDRDSDNDGLPDRIEMNRRAISQVDTDMDGIDDVWDVEALGGTDEDNDGIDDIYSQIDTDEDGVPDYLDTDSDNDGISDSQEQLSVSASGLDMNLNGVDDAFDPEFTLGIDDNNDGVDDHVYHHRDFDRDGIYDFRDTDSDGDTVPDRKERNVDTDGDGSPDYLDLDSDNDGILDRDEDGDFNHDGIDDRVQKRQQVETGLQGNGGSLTFVSIAFVLLTLFFRTGSKLLVTCTLASSILLSSVVNAKCQPLSEVWLDCAYLGGGIGVSLLNPDENSTAWSQQNRTDFAWKIQAGLDRKDWFLQAAYVSLGRVELANANPAIGEIQVGYQTYGLEAGYRFLKIDQAVSTYLMAGIHWLDTDTNQYVTQTNGMQLSVGAGIDWMLTKNVNTRLNFTAYDLDAQHIGIELNYLWRNESKSVYSTNSVESYTETEKNSAPFEVSTANIYFDSGQYRLTEQQKTVVEGFADAIEGLELTGIVQISGYADALGQGDTNQVLSVKRALEVESALKNALQGSDIKVELKGYGESNLIPNRPMTHYQNRRVELQWYAREYK